MITILKNTFIIYIGLLCLSTIGTLFICLDPEYQSQCPPHITSLLLQIISIPQVNEFRLFIIPLVKQLPQHWIYILIWSSIIMITAFTLSIMYYLTKVTYKLFINLLKLVIILVIVSFIILFILEQEIPYKMDLDYIMKLMQIFRQ